VVTAYRLIEFINILRQSREDDDRFVINGALGKPLSKIKELTDVDISKCFTFRDSTWTFMNGGQAYESDSTNIMVNFAYGDECNLLRYVHDVTRAGTRRDKRPSGTKADWYHWFYTKYENYDDSKIRKLTKEEEEVFLYTKWNLPWPMSDDVMKISDLFTDLYVATYAQPDKWATLPLVGKTARQPYRTRRDDYKLSDYVFKKGADFKKNMYNEPILVCRLMKVDDNGSSIQTAPDGSPLSILYHSTDINFKILCNTQWIASYTTHIGEEIPEVFLNNEAYQLPALPTKQ
ncbi:MAG: hypothetical protein J6W45_01980, partial [Bacteroidales bacterium]|nr:hypothetical protein [Bacteroidales bacterium]